MMTMVASHQAVDMEEEKTTEDQRDDGGHGDLMTIVLILWINTVGPGGMYRPILIQCCFFYLQQPMMMMMMMMIRLVVSMIVVVLLLQDHHS